MSKRNDYNNGGFVVPNTQSSDVKILVDGLKEMIERLGELLLVTPPPSNPEV